MGFCWTTFGFQNIGLLRGGRWKNLILNSRVEKQRVENTKDENEMFRKC